MRLRRISLGEELRHRSLGTDRRADAKGLALPKKHEYDEPKRDAPCYPKATMRLSASFVNEDVVGLRAQFQRRNQLCEAAMKRGDTVATSPIGGPSSL